MAGALIRATMGATQAEARNGAGLVSDIGLRDVEDRLLCCFLLVLGLFVLSPAVDCVLRGCSGDLHHPSSASTRFLQPPSVRSLLAHCCLQAMYLLLYNAVNSLLWARLFLSVLSTPLPALYASVEPLARWTQTLSIAEIVHAALGTYAGLLRYSGLHIRKEV